MVFKLLYSNPIVRTFSLKECAVVSVAPFERAIFNRLSILLLLNIYLYFSAKCDRVTPVCFMRDEFSAALNSGFMIYNIINSHCNNSTALLPKMFNEVFFNDPIILNMILSTIIFLYVSFI